MDLNSAIDFTLSPDNQTVIVTAQSLRAARTFPHENTIFAVQ